ncbi:MAG: hypothetical protein OXC95_11190 [Dehalococcoidia bacterium]|nr:hypothetical protein [Dehalococcoidia bacterium]
MTITFDLRTKTFAPPRNAFRLFPGDGYRFYDIMCEHSVVFLDAPMMSLPGRHGYPETHSTLLELARAEIASHPRFSIDDERYLELPSLHDNTPPSFGVIPVSSTILWSQKRRQMLRWINMLHHEANIGDIVMLPSPGYIKIKDGTYAEVQTLVGEITSNSFRWFPPHDSAFHSKNYIARQVEWRGGIKEHELGKTTTKLLRTQNAMLKVNSRDFPLVLGRAYGNALVDDDCYARFSTSSDSFTSFYNFHFHALCMAVVAALSDDGQHNGLFDNDKHIYEILSGFSPSDDLFPEIIINIQSPGDAIFKSKKTLIALVFSSLVAASDAVGTDLFDASGLRETQLINSTDTLPPECLPTIDMQKKKTLDIIGMERWRQLCQGLAMVPAGHGLRPEVKVTRDGSQ